MCVQKQFILQIMYFIASFWWHFQWPIPKSVDVTERYFAYIMFCIWILNISIFCPPYYIMPAHYCPTNRQTPLLIQGRYEHWSLLLLKTAWRFQTYTDSKSRSSPGFLTMFSFTDISDVQDKLKSTYALKKTRWHILNTHGYILARIYNLFISVAGISTDKKYSFEK